MINVYSTDSLKSQLSIADFSKNILSQAATSISEDTVDSYFEYGPNWRLIVDNLMNEKYTARDLYQLEINEKVLFDKQRSCLYYDLQTITLFIPADHPMNTKRIQIPVASFSCKEVSEKIFKDNPKAIWCNVQNDHENKNLADVFDLRLFSSYIIKVSNVKDAYLTDMYSDQQKALIASMWEAPALMEYEHNLWEY